MAKPSVASSGIGLTEAVADIDGALNYFELPFFDCVTFSVCKDADAEDLATGAYMLTNLAQRVTNDLAHRDDSSDDAAATAHVISVVLAVACGAITSIGARINSAYGWGGLPPSKKAGRSERAART
jgi:hypothetical protein